MRTDYLTEALLTLLRVGLWDGVVKVNASGLEVTNLPEANNFDMVLRYADEQCVFMDAPGIVAMVWKPMHKQPAYQG